MKKLLLILAIGLSFVSCKKEDVAPKTDPQPPVEVVGSTITIKCTSAGGGGSFIKHNVTYTDVWGNDTTMLWYPVSTTSTIPNVDFTKNFVVSEFRFGFQGSNQWYNTPYDVVIKKDGVIIDAAYDQVGWSYGYQN